uniref:Uncharacterized protein n=1 Tax=Glossina austeni TaxID=7395 RepID=A0A1A9V5M4_GLOAU
MHTNDQNFGRCSYKTLMQKFYEPNASPRRGGGNIFFNYWISGGGGNIFFNYWISYLNRFLHFDESNFEPRSSSSSLATEKANLQIRSVFTVLLQVTTGVVSGDSPYVRQL